MNEEDDRSIDRVRSARVDSTLRLDVSPSPHSHSLAGRLPAGCEGILARIHATLRWPRRARRFAGSEEIGEQLNRIVQRQRTVVVNIGRVRTTQRHTREQMTQNGDRV